MGREAKLIVTSENRAQAGLASAKSDLLGFEAAAKKVGDTLRNAFTVLGLVESGRKIARFGADCAEAFGDMERTMLQLQAAVGGSASRFTNLTGLIDDMTRKTTASKDDIEALVAELASLGKSDVDIAKITNAAVNLSNVTGKDLTVAFLLINGTYSGTLGKLSKLVPELGNLTEAQLAAGGAVDALNVKLGAITDNMATGYAQAVTNMKNTWGEFMEALGSNLAPIFEPMLQWIGNIVDKWTSGLTEYRKYRNALSKDAAVRTTEENLVIASGQRADLQRSQALKMRAAGFDETDPRGPGTSYAGALASTSEAVKIAAVDIAIMGLQKDLDIARAAADVAAAGTGSAVPDLGGTSGKPAIVELAPMTLPPMEAALYDAFANAPSPDSYAPAEASPYFGPAPAGKSGIEKILDDVTGKFSGMLTSLSSVQQILDPISTILTGMFEVLAPLIDEALAPMIGILKILGNALGAVLAPVVIFLGVILKGLADIFVWFANHIIIPVGNMFIGIFRAVIDALNMIPFVDIKKPSYIKAISLEGSETSGTSTSGGSTGTGASYSGAQSITFNFYNQGNVVGSGGLEELAVLIDSIIKRNARYI
ncbi:MAG: phage tail tape measure protein [Spirochaetes bacterium]|nr:phage tail tape measure protein [Spirochaetota bacterium]